MRPAHPVRVHHHDVLGPAGLADPFRGDLYGALHGRQGRLQVPGDLRLGRRGLRDRERPAHGLVVELGAERGEEQPRREYGDPGGYRHLHQQHLRERPPRQTEAQSSCGGVGLIPMTVRGSARRSEGVWRGSLEWGVGKLWSAGRGPACSGLLVSRLRGSWPGASPVRPPRPSGPGNPGPSRSSPGGAAVRRPARR